MFFNVFCWVPGGLGKDPSEQGSEGCEENPDHVSPPHPGFQARPELLEVFSTEFQMRLLWGSQGANSSQARRYEKFDKVLTALSHKLEPAIRSSEL